MEPKPRATAPSTLSNSAIVAFLHMEISLRNTHLGGPAAQTWNQPANRSHVSCLLPTTTTPPRFSATAVVEHRPCPPLSNADPGESHPFPQHHECSRGAK